MQPGERHRFRVFDLPVKDFAESPDTVKALSQNRPVKEALLMLKRGVLAIPIVDEGEQVVGILTLSDTTRVIEEYKKDTEHKLQIRDVMTRKPYFAYENDTIESQLDLMRKMDFVTGVPVVDRATNKYRGFLSRHGAVTKLNSLIESMKAEIR